MKMRKLAAVAAVFGMLIGSAFPVSAADADVITFDGNAKQFVTNISGDLENGFENMLPGEQRTLRLELENQSSEELKFFMSSDILQTDIAEKGDKQAVYDFMIARDGEAFFEAVIGGENEQNISIGKEYLTEDRNILLATLKKGQSTVVEISIALDGDSMGNTYMNTEGALSLRFSAETPEGATTIVQTVTKQVKQTATRVVRTVRTGDTFPVAVLTAMGVSLIVIVGILVKKRKERVEE